MVERLEHRSFPLEELDCFPVLEEVQVEEFGNGPVPGFHVQDEERDSRPAPAQLPLDPVPVPQQITGSHGTSSLVDSWCGIAQSDPFPAPPFKLCVPFSGTQLTDEFS